MEQQQMRNDYMDQVLREQVQLENALKVQRVASPAQAGRRGGGSDGTRFFQAEAPGADAGSGAESNGEKKK